MPTPMQGFMMSSDPMEASLWQKLMNNSSSVDGNFNPLVNQGIVTGQPPEASFSPNFDPATLNQPKAAPPMPAPQGAPKASGIQPIQGIQPLAPAPMNPMLAGMSSGPNSPSSRKVGAEQQIYSLLNSTQNNPSVDAQQDSINKYKQLIDQYSQKQVGGLNSLNLAPLAALADSMVKGSHLAANYTPPESQEQHEKNLMALNSNLSQLQGGLTKEQNDLLKDKLTALVGIDKANKDMSMLSGMMMRTDETNHRAVLQDIKKDPTLNQRLQQQTNLSNALSQIDNAQIKTPQQFDELQQSIRSNLGIKGTSGLDERERNYFNSLGLKADRAEQLLFGKPVDVSESQGDFINHLKNLVSIEQGNIKAQVGQRIKTLAAGNEAMYQRRPDLYHGLLNLQNTAQEQYNPNTLVGTPPAPSVQIAPNVADKYKNYTDEQLKEMLAKKGKGNS